MSRLTDIFTDIANSLRSKMQSGTTYKPNEMAPAINNIELTSENMYANAACWNNNGTFETYSKFVCAIANKSFNEEPVIPDGKDNLIYAFSDCTEFNQPVNIPDSVTDMYGAFVNCNNFNQPVNIPSGVTNVARMFWHCTNFNQPINIPNGVTNMHDTFSGCWSFNQPITIPDSVTNMYGTFYQCRNLLKQTIIIPNNVVDVTDMLRGSNFYNGVLIFPNANPRLAIGCHGIFAAPPMPIAYKTIICTPDKDYLFTKNNSYNSITRTDVTWTAMDDNNGYYNARYKINIYNNYGL